MGVLAVRGRDKNNGRFQRVVGQPDVLIDTKRKVGAQSGYTGSWAPPVFERGPLGGVRTN